MGKNKPQFRTYYVVVFSVMVLACSQPEIEQAALSFEEYTSWVHNQEDKLTTDTEEEWAAVRQEFERKTAEMEKHVRRLPAEKQQEFAELKEKFEEWDERHKLYTERQYIRQSLYPEQEKHAER